MSSQQDTKRIWQYINRIAKERNTEPKTVYLWAVRKVAPPQTLKLSDKLADQFVEYWKEKGIGESAEKIETTDGETIQLTRGISGFSQEETEQIIKLLEEVAWKYKISLLSDEENALFKSYYW